MFRTLLRCIAAIVFLAAPANAADLPWLKADGPKIVDESGKPTSLRGVNLGGWLVEEMWMMPFATKPPASSKQPEIKDHVSLWRTVERRLGKKEAAHVRTALRNAWITDADFDRIRAAGMNCMRLPFTYDLLEEANGVSWLDTAIDRAKARGLYVIVDLHGAPGRQSGDHHTGEAGIDRLFKDPAKVAETEKLWVTLAQHYRDRPEVAAYDLFNEPMGAPDVATLYLVQDRLYRAIRAVDPRHLIVVEDGYKGIDTFPRPAIVGWTNVVLSTHHYRFDAKSAEDQMKGAEGHVEAAVKLQESRQAPYLLGEFQQEPHGSPATMAAFLRALDAKGISWTVWTYKTAMTRGGGGMWGWYRSPKRLEPINAFQDSAKEWLRKIEQVRTEQLTEDTGLTAAFRGDATTKMDSRK